MERIQSISLNINGLGVSTGTVATGSGSNLAGISIVGSTTGSAVIF